MDVLFTDLGLMGYRQAWDLQESLLKEGIALKTAARLGDREYDPKQLATQSYFLLVEHPPVYTLGKSGDMAHVLIGEEERAARGIEFYHTNRGGDITFHGPGQIVGYPILDLEKL